MKKIIFLIISMLFLSGCYDYKEINNLAFVSAMGIDYQNDEYIVSLELLNAKSEKDSKEITSYIKMGKDKSLAKAIENAASTIVNQANYTHITLMIISENIAENKIDTLTDYFLRSTYFRDNFYLVSSLSDNPYDILNNTTEENPVASKAITDLLKNNNYASNSAILKTFDEVIEEIISFGIDTCFTNIKLDQKEFVIDGMTIFKDYKMATKLDNKDATLYNVLTNNYYRPTISKDYDGKTFAVALATGKTDISLEKDELSLKGEIHGKIMDNDTEFNIRSLKELDKINEDFSQILNEDFKNFLKHLQDNKSDILGISESYYKKSRKKNKELWKNADIKTDIKFLINKKGLIYGVLDEK